MNAEKDILERLSREMPGFSKRQRNIASFICDNCDKAAFMTAEMLSEAADVSESTVVRFAVELGYDGYPGLRKALQMVLRERLDSSKSPEIHKNLSRNSEIFSKALSSDAEGIRRSVSENNYINFERMSELIKDSPEVFIIGFDGLYPLCEYMENSLSIIRKNVRSLRGEILTYLSSMSEDALLIILCGDRGTVPRIGLARFAVERKARVALICTGELSTALSYTDCVIEAESNAGILSIIDALSDAVTASEGYKPEERRAEIDKLRMEYMNNGK